MILEFQGKRPRFDNTVFIAQNATVIGDVELGTGANVWFYSLLRGDANTIRIGADCNIQDGCILHADTGPFALDLEDGVVLGHRVTVHGCRIGRGAMIGMGATVLNGARIGEEAIVGAGAVVSPGTVIPPRMLALGIPAKPVRALGEKDFAMILHTRENYRNLMEIYRHMQD
jgi:carbonic anhydrase/acetyltransferase-like protein (isoleucine patch superfamily)